MTMRASENSPKRLASSAPGRRPSRRHRAPSGLIVDALIEPPATPSFRSIPMPSKPAGRGIAPPAARAIPATRSCSPTSCALTESPSSAHALLRRNQGVAPLVRGRGRPGRRARLPGQPAARPSGKVRAGAAVIFADVDSPIALAFVQRYPTPESAARLGEKRLAAFLAAHAYCGRRDPSALLDRLRAAPISPCGPAEAEAEGEIVRPGGRPRAHRRRNRRNSPAASSMTSPNRPTAGSSCPSRAPGASAPPRILAELGDVRERFQSADQLAAEAGSPRHPRPPEKAGRRLPMGLQPPSESRHNLLRRQFQTPVPLGR